MPGIENYEGTHVHYAVRQMEKFRDKHVVIAGGGDSALDWLHALHPLAKSVSLIHRRDEFRAAPDSISEDARAGRGPKSANLHIAQLMGLKGDGRPAGSGDCENEKAVRPTYPADMLLPFYGLTMKLGPLAEWGLNLDRNLIPVDTARFETSSPGIFAIGDINTYPGKLKLILSGFHEAALMAHAAYGIVNPGKTPRFQYTTSSSELQGKLGVSGSKPEPCHPERSEGSSLATKR